MSQFAAAQKVINRAAAAIWYDWLSLVLMNLLWLMSIVTIVFAAPATLGLFYTTNEIAHQRASRLADFFEGAKRYLAVSYLWLLTNVLAAVLVAANLRFYGQFDSLWAASLNLLTVFLATVWLIVQFYALPYLIEQERKNLLVAYRNGLFTALASPLFTLTLALVIGLLIALILWQPFIVLLGIGPLIALLANFAVVERLETFGIRDRERAKANDQSEV